MIELIIQGNRIDLNKDLPDLQFRKQIQDFNDLSQRGSDYSLPFNIPMTLNNQKVFGFINDLNTENIFNRVEHYTAEFRSDSTTLLRGYFQVLEINEHEVRGNLIASNNFKFTLHDKTLQDLNFEPILLNGHRSGFQPDFTTHDDISDFKFQDSWDESTNPYWDLISFPLISYGNFYDNVDDSEKVLPTEISWKDLTPAVSVIEIYKQIYKEAGFTVDSEIFDTDDFKRLFLAYTGTTEPIWNWAHLTKALSDNNNYTRMLRKYSISPPAGTVNANPNPEYQDGIFGIDTVWRFFVPLNGIAYDYSDTFNTDDAYMNNNVGYTWTCPKSGIYTFDLDLYFDIRYEYYAGQDADGIALSQKTGTFMLYKLVGDGNNGAGSQIEAELKYAQEQFTPQPIFDENVIVYCRPALEGSDFYNPLGYEYKVGAGSLDTDIITYNNPYVYTQTFNASSSGVTSFTQSGVGFYRDVNAGSKKLNLKFSTKLEVGDQLQPIYFINNPGTTFAADSYDMAQDVQIKLDKFYVKYSEDADENFIISKNLPKIKQADFIKEVNTRLNLLYKVEGNNITVYKKKDFLKPHSDIDISAYVDIKKATWRKIHTYQNFIFGFVSDTEDDYAEITEQERRLILTDNVYSDFEIDLRSNMFAPCQDVQYRYSSSGTAGMEFYSIPTISIDKKFEKRNEFEPDYNTTPRIFFRGQGNGSSVDYTKPITTFEMSGISLSEIPVGQFRNTQTDGLQLNYFDDNSKNIFNEFFNDTYLDMSGSLLVSLDIFCPPIVYSKLELDNPVYVGNQKYYLESISYNPIEERGKVTLLKK